MLHRSCPGEPSSGPLRSGEKTRVGHWNRHLRLAECQRPKLNVGGSSPSLGPSLGAALLASTCWCTFWPHACPCRKRHKQAHASRPAAKGTFTDASTPQTGKGQEVFRMVADYHPEEVPRAIVGSSPCPEPITSKHRNWTRFPSFSSRPSLRSPLQERVFSPTTDPPQSVSVSSWRSSGPTLFPEEGPRDRAGALRRGTACWWCQLQFRCCFSGVAHQDVIDNCPYLHSCMGVKDEESNRGASNLIWLKGGSFYDDSR